MKYLILLLPILFISCSRDDKAYTFDEKFKSNPEYVSDGFDFPVGIPDSEGFYNAQKFTENNHLGEDWNGNGGGNTDLGEPIHSIANGFVFFVDDVGQGWGNVIRIIHKMPDGHQFEYVESLYAHCDQTLVKSGEFVKKGQQIGTIGNNNGQYYAHLHLEIRDFVAYFLGGGYSEITFGFLNPTEFIEKNR